MRVGVVLTVLSLVFAPNVAAHADGAFWPVGKVMVALDGARVRIGTKVIRLNADTMLCSGEGRPRLRKGVRTWTHFRCTFTTFTARGPGRDVEFRVHALGVRRMLITNPRWVLG